MVMEKGTKSKQKAKQRPGPRKRRARTTGSHRHPPSDEDTRVASPEAQARRTRSTLKEVEFTATEAPLTTTRYLDSHQIHAITIGYGADTREERGLLTCDLLSDKIFTPDLRNNLCRLLWAL